jgi:hypothetical protein
MNPTKPAIACGPRASRVIRVFGRPIEMERAVELAGFFAAHAVWCVAEGETLVPILAFQRQDGQQEFRRLEAVELQDAVAKGKEWLAGNPENVSCAVLVYDAFIPLPGGKTDCLMLEIRSYGDLQSLSVALPYRHADKSGGFAIHRPKFFTRPEGEGRVSDCGDAFFRGVAQHEKGSAVWNTHLDETR